MAAIADARQAVDKAAVEYAQVCEGESEMRRKMRPDLVVEGAVRVQGGDSSRGYEHIVECKSFGVNTA